MLTLSNRKALREKSEKALTFVTVAELDDMGFGAEDNEKAKVKGGSNIKILIRLQSTVHSFVFAL